MNLRACVEWMDRLCGAAGFRAASLAVFLIGGSMLSGGCQVKPGTPVPRHGDEIVIAGQLFHTGTPVVLWMDPGGYDAYRVDKRFSDFDHRDFQTWSDEDKAKDPQRYNLRTHNMTEDELEQVRGGGWELEKLRDVVDQFVIHYDVCGTSQRCFNVLHDHRHLSVHFMLDIDGTLYQTLDAKERAWHAGTANSRSIGIEIANMGAYAESEDKPWERWYAKDDQGRTYITVPNQSDAESIRTPNFVGYPARNEPVVGVIQGKVREQYDLTNEQYDALIKLTATLHRVLPKIALQYPVDEEGQLIPHLLSEEQQASYQGLIGHYHVSGRKADPGPAFDWDRVVNGARRLSR